MYPLIIVVDKFPLSASAIRLGERSKALTIACRQWLRDCNAAGHRLIVPAIAYYETLREFERQIGKRQNRPFANILSGRTGPLPLHYGRAFGRSGPLMGRRSNRRSANRQRCGFRWRRYFSRAGSGFCGAGSEPRPTATSSLQRIQNTSLGSSTLRNGKILFPERVDSRRGGALQFRQSTLPRADGTKRYPHENPAPFAARHRFNSPISEGVSDGRSDGCVLRRDERSSASPRDPAVLRRRNVWRPGRPAVYRDGVFLVPE